MKSYFRNEQCNQLFHSWLNLYPESFHPLDKERFYKFLLSLFENDEELTEDILTEAIKHEKKWINSFRDDFVQKKIQEYYMLKDFWSFSNALGN